MKVPGYWDSHAGYGAAIGGSVRNDLQAKSLFAGFFFFAAFTNFLFSKFFIINSHSSL